MKKAFSLLVVLGLTLGFASTAAANGRRCGGSARGVNQRQRHQQGRIFHGVRSGELTRRETFRLGREQFSIAREERRYKRDGEVTARERAELQRELNQASRHIYRATHNNRDRN